MTQDAYDPSEQDRLWAHRLHEDMILYERHSFFLVAESLLLVAFAQLLVDKEEFAAVVLGGAGLVLTATWLYSNRRQRAVISNVQRQAVRYLPEFRNTVGDKPKARIGSEWVLAVFVPMLISAIWLLLLVIAFT